MNYFKKIIVLVLLSMSLTSNVKAASLNTDELQRVRQALISLQDMNSKYETARLAFETCFQQAGEDISMKASKRLLRKAGENLQEVLIRGTNIVMTINTIKDSIAFSSEGETIRQAIIETCTTVRTQCRRYLTWLNEGEHRTLLGINL